MRTQLRTAVALVAAVATLSLAACSSGSDDDTEPTGDGDTTTSSEAGAGEGEWPRTVEHEAGSTEITEQPLRIVSTSITLTGTLLAIDAPVVASAATTVGPLTDDDGFFTQWADVAAERGVEVLYPDLELDLEAIEVAEPDLIVGSTTGADATTDAYDQLSEIAPTILLDYGSYSWQDLAEILGEATGLEEQASTVVSDFDTWVGEQAASITLPAQPTTALVYNGADGVMVFTPESAQGTLLADLGFEYVGADAEFADTARTDAWAVTQENAAAALEPVQTILLVFTADTEALLADPLLANQAAVAGESVAALGLTSFRIDYYSATELVELVVETYGS